MVNQKPTILKFATIPQWIPFFLPCSQNRNTDENCTEVEGVGAKVLKHLGELFNIPIEIVNAATNDSVYAMLRKDEIDALGPNFRLRDDDVRNGTLYTSLPIDHCPLAVLIRNTSSTPVKYSVVSYFSQSAWFLLGGTLLILAIMKYGPAKCAQKKDSDCVSSKLVQLVIVSYSLLLATLLNFYASSLSIKLFHNSVPGLPFSSYTQLSEMLYDGRIKAVIPTDNDVTEMSLQLKTSTPAQPLRFVKLKNVAQRVPSSQLTNAEIDHYLDRGYIYIAEYETTKLKSIQVCDASLIVLPDFPFYLRFFIFSNPNHWLRQHLDQGVMEILKALYDQELEKYWYKTRQTSANITSCSNTGESTKGLNTGQFPDLARPCIIGLIASIIWFMYEIVNKYLF